MDEELEAILQLASFNADWIKTPKNRRTEKEIHEALEKEQREREEESEEE